MLGGSSAINSMVYLRGFPKDYDEWAAMGNAGWDYETVLATYKRMEDNQAEDMAADEMYHATGGLLKIDYYYSADPIRFIFLNASREFDYKWVDDFNGRDRLGYAFTQGTLAHGERQSSARAYLVPAKDRRNLHVIKHAHVIDLIFDDDDNDRVVGVSFNYNNKAMMKAFAKREVILSAGSVNTPQILMLSGIGPRENLDEVHIRVKKELPVGKNLQDHVVSTLFFRFDKYDKEVPMDQVLDNVYQYMRYKRGPMTAPESADFIGFISTLNGSHPDIQTQNYVFHPKMPEFEIYLRNRAYKDAIVDQLVAINQEVTICIVYLILTNPKSIGKLELRSRSPIFKPRIYPNYLDSQEDVDSIVRAAQFYSKFDETAAFKETGGHLIRIDSLRGCDQYEYQSPKYWECYVRHFSTTLYHPSGTAKMGPKSDKEAVVDSKLRVYGIEGLRIVDASIMPKLVTVNTNGPSMMIGERGADFIKEQWTGQ